MRAPRHLHLAVRILDRCGVDDAVIGDMLEVYETRPSALRVWREVAGALGARLISHARDNTPQTIRRVATTLATLGFLGYSIPASTHVDLAASVRVEDVSGGWYVAMAGNGRTRLLPTVSFQLRNVSTSPLSLVQVNVLFRREGDQETWSDVYRRAISSRALESGTATQPIVVQAPVGYTGEETTGRLLNHSKFVDTAVAIYARHGSDRWTYLGEYPIPRRVVGHEPPQYTPRRSATAFHIR